MSTIKLEAKAGLTVLKPINQVFEAIVDPAQMTNYFISKSSGRMEEGATVTWRFPEFDMEFPVTIDTVQQEYISFRWPGEDGTETKVDIRLQAKGDSATIIRITEGEKDLNDENLKWFRGNTEGWANFLACLKAWVEYGINLRKGAFEPAQMPVEAIQ